MGRNIAPSWFQANAFCYFFPMKFFFYLNFMSYSQNFWKCREQENISSNFHLVGLNFISIIDGWNNLSLYQYMSWVRGVVEHPWQFINWKSLDFLCIGWVPIFAGCCLNCSMCFREYSFVWVAISIDNASGIKIYKKYISCLLFSITVVGPVNSAI